MFPGETILSGALAQGTKLAVHKSAAGYYIGTMTEEGPYSRESCYFATADEAREQFAEWEQLAWNANAYVTDSDSPHFVLALRCLYELGLLKGARA